MAPVHGLVHPKEYDIKDSNVELIGTDIDHKVKYASAASEPAWNDGAVGLSAGLFVWRIEQFEVVAWPKDRHGTFFDGDSYIVLHSVKAGTTADEAKLAHDVFFWLGAHTTQDEAGTAAYKTVELDEFLRGAAVQHREVQESPSDAFLALFPRLTLRRGGVRSGFRHVEPDATPADVTTLLRVFKHPGGGPGRDTVVVVEVEPAWASLDDGDVFVLDKGDKIWVWQGAASSPMEKAKAAQVVHDMTLAKHVDVEVLSAAESRSRLVVDLLGGKDAAPRQGFQAKRPVSSISRAPPASGRSRRLWRLSDASGELSFEVVRDGDAISQKDLDGKDIFLLDDAGREIWVWEGKGASKAERAMWLEVAQAYVRQVQGEHPEGQAYLTPIAKVHEGNESAAFWRAVKA